MEKMKIELNYYELVVLCRSLDTLKREYVKVDEEHKFEEKYGELFEKLKKARDGEMTRAVDKGLSYDPENYEKLPTDQELNRERESRMEGF